MRCVMCGRPLQFAAVTIPKMGGNCFYGPKCARRAGLIEPKQKRAPSLFRRAKWEPAVPSADPSQQDLWEAACAGPL